MLNAGRGALYVRFRSLQCRPLGFDFSRDLLPVELGQQLSLVHMLVDVHVQVLHDPAGLRFQLDLGDGLYFARRDHALIDLPPRHLVQAAGLEVGTSPVHAQKHQARNRDDGEQTTPNPDPFAFSLRRHKSPKPI